MSAGTGLRLPAHIVHAREKRTVATGGIRGTIESEASRRCLLQEKASGGVEKRCTRKREIRVRVTTAALGCGRGQRPMS